MPACPLWIRKCTGKPVPGNQPREMGLWPPRGLQGCWLGQGYRSHPTSDRRSFHDGYQGERRPGPVGYGWWVIDLQIPEDLHCVWRPKPIHSTPSKQGSEGARPVDAAREGLENRRRSQGGRQRDSPRPPSRSTAKTRRRLSMACSRRGNRCSSTGVIPGVPRVPSCAGAAQPAGLCPVGRGSETLPSGGGARRGAARRWRALTQATSVWGLPSLGIISVSLAAEVHQLSALGGVCSHSKTVAGWLRGVTAPRHTHTAGVACVSAAAAWNLTSAELHCTTARKEMEPHSAGGGKKAD